jgi:hypothetical protein
MIIIGKIRHGQKRRYYDRIGRMMQRYNALRAAMANVELIYPDGPVMPWIEYP